LMPVVLIGMVLGSLADAGELSVCVEDLRCENLKDPVGIDAERPRLGWKIEERSQKSESRSQDTASRGIKQTAYQILVASSEELLKKDQGDLWDSGKFETDQSVAVKYGGKPLVSGRMYCWKVRIWAKGGGNPNPVPDAVSGWSESARFMTGKLNAADWKGKWIGAPTGLRQHPHGAVYLRKEFACIKEVKRATVFFCGLGFSELYIDGTKIGDYVIGPGFTTYDKRVQYLAFDVTDRLCVPGNKRLDVLLADGWYALEKDPWVHHFEKKPYVDKPKLLLNLQLEFHDGSEEVLVSDESWKWAEGEIVRSWIAAEDIDRRAAGEQNQKWQPVAVMPGPAGRLVCQLEPFCKVVENIKPVSMKYDPQTRSAVWDLGREINGWVRFQTSGPSGSVISITTVPENLKRRISLFTLAGTGGKEMYEPRFFHAGMRTVEVGGLVEVPATNDLTACQVSSMYTPSGGFRCSDEGLTALHDAARRTVVNYTTFLPNDPVREWKAWVQDIQNMFWSAVYLFDSRRMYERWQWDMLDGQVESGNCAMVAPGPAYGPCNSPWWGGCLVWLPQEYQLYYGDDSLLRRSYDAMKRYVDYLSKVGCDWGLLDWLAVEETPRAVINTPAYYRYAQTVARTARLLGKEVDARTYEQLAETIRDQFNKEFLDPATGIYGVRGWKVRPANWKPPVPIERLHEIWWPGDRPCTQAGQVLPLALGMVPVEYKGAVEQALCKEISAHHDRVSTGFVATPYLLKVLADLDPEAGWRMTSARDFPSWYFMTFSKGGDLMKETWSGGQALMPSLGGNIVVWNMESLGGLRPDPAGPGFRRFIIKPNVVGNLSWVECWHESNYGRIVSNWKREGNKLTMDVTVPPNTMATVHVPARKAEVVMESEKPAGKAEGVKFLKMENGAAVYEAGSGHYCFSSDTGNSTDHMEAQQ
jgi:alpha-L-rhamnosidase